MKTMHTECNRYSSTEAIERLVDWVRNLDTDGLAKAMSECVEPWGKGCQPVPVVVFDDQGGDDESAPYVEGKRLRVVYVLDDSQGLI